MYVESMYDAHAGATYYFMLIVNEIDAPWVKEGEGMIKGEGEKGEKS